VQIEIEPLTETSKPFAHTYSPAELPLADEGARLLTAAQVAGRISRKRQRLHVEGAITAEVEVNCDRCLAPITVSVKTEFDVSYDPAGMEEAAENELHADDLATSFYSGESLDLDELVREQLLLALPTRSLCRAECRGMCPTCGIDLNTQTCNCAQKEIDPRWAGLAGLKNREE
jgi:uncharacterized protein